MNLVVGRDSGGRGGRTEENGTEDFSLSSPFLSPSAELLLVNVWRNNHEDVTVSEVS